MEFEATASGRRRVCQVCRREYQARRRERDRESLSAAQRARYAADPERWRADARARYDAEKQRAARLADLERVRERDRIYARSRRADPKYHARKIDYNRERRARLRGVESERYEGREILDRDGWICQLCFEPIDPSIEWPDPRSASIDHVVPISKGGADAPSNVQAAHLGCNCSKRDGRLIDEHGTPVRVSTGRHII